MHRNLFLFQRIYISGEEHKTNKNRKISQKEQNIPSKILLKKHNSPGYDKPIKMTPSLQSGDEALPKKGKSLQLRY